MSTAAEAADKRLDEQLVYTNELRLKIIEKLTKDEKTGEFTLPEDVKEQATLMKAIDGIDKNALGIKRIKVEDKAAENNAATASMIAELYKEVGRRERSSDVPEVPAGFKPPTLGDDIAPPQIVEGHTEITPAQQSYENFMGEGASPNEAPRV